MAENTMEFEVKRYLMKLISDKYKILRGQLYKAFGQGGYASAYSEIINKFMGGNYTTERRMINEHKERFSKKGYADYNYFDLESLYSYLTFLTMLTDKINDYTYHNGRREVTSRIYSTALADTIQFFTRNKEQESTGYYTGSVVLSRKEGDHAELNPVKTNNDKVDMSKARDYQAFIQEYVESKHRKRTYADVMPAQKESTQKTIQLPKVEDDPIDVIVYKYKGRKIKLTIIKEEKFYSENGYPVFRIWAIAPEGRLFRTVDCDDRLYMGALYNADYEEVGGPDESGEVFYPNYDFKKSLGENIEESPVSAEEQKKRKKLNHGLDNLSIFDFDDREIDD